MEIKIAKIWTNSKGIYNTSCGDNRPTECYSRWRGIVNRCFSPKRRESYKECLLSEDWSDFQDFAEWYHTNPYQRVDYDIDKDLLIINNKIYGPDTCVFLPKVINTNLIIIKNNVEFDYPFIKRHPYTDNRFMPSLKCKELGIGYKTYKTQEEAFQAAMLAKEHKIKLLAEDYKDSIDPRAYLALMRWSILERMKL